MLFIFLFCISNFSYLLAQENYNSIFQETLYVQPKPIVQLEFTYSVDVNKLILSFSGSGTVTQEDGMAKIKTGTTQNSIAVLVSKDRLTYKPGQGLESFFSAIFQAGVVNGIQIIGIGNLENGFFFGYNGVSFGILYRNNSVDTWIDQDNWNIDTMNGSGSSGIILNPLMGNIYRIQYHWLGFGVVKFYIQDPNNGEWILVHSLKLLNNQVSPMITNGSSQLFASVYTSNGATSDITLKTASMAGMIQGKTTITTNSRFGYDASTTTGFFRSASSALNLFTLGNRLEYPTGGLINQTMIYPDTLSLYNNSGQTVYFYLYRNVSNLFTYTNIDTTTSVAEVYLSTTSSGDLITGGTLLDFFIVPNNSEGLIIDLSSLQIQLAPGETLTIAAAKTVGGFLNLSTVNVYASLSWTEGL